MPEVTDGFEDVVDKVLMLPDWDDRAAGAVGQAVSELQAKLRVQWDELQVQRAGVERTFEGSIRATWDEDWRTLLSLHGQLVEMLDGVPGRLTEGYDARETLKRQRLDAVGLVSPVGPAVNLANGIYNWVVD